MKVEPVAYLKTWTRDGEERKRVDICPEPDAWMDSFKATPLHAIPPGYALVRVEQVKDAERLDFLDGNLKFSMGWQVNKAPVGNVGVHSIIFAGRLPVTIREAIDKAMLTAAAKGE